MLTLPLLTASFVFAGLSLCVLALLLSRQGPSTPALHFAAIITTVLGSVAFVVALRLWGESQLAATAADRAPAPAYRTQASIRTGAQQTDGEDALTATRVVPCGAGRLCDTARHTEDRLKPATRPAWESSY
jgi:hypothetical protein